MINIFNFNSEITKYTENLCGIWKVNTMKPLQCLKTAFMTKLKYFFSHSHHIGSETKIYIKYFI